MELEIQQAKFPVRGWESVICKGSGLLVEVVVWFRKIDKRGAA
jgi:hypothetical protein